MHLWCRFYLGLGIIIWSAFIWETNLGTSDPSKWWPSAKWMDILGPLPLIMASGNQYAQLVDNNGSASGDNSCQGEQSPTGGQKNGSLIWRRYKKDIKKGQFLTEENWHHSPWSGRKGKPWTWHFDHFKFEVQSGEKWQQALDKRCPPSSRIWPIA